MSKNNIEFVSLAVKFVKCFNELIKEYKKEYDKRMKIERKDIMKC